MIPHYPDHAANERTYLAWIRTGIAIIAFGFVVEKFRLFLILFARSSDAASKIPLDQASTTSERLDGILFVLLGVAVIVAATARFVRTSRLIDSDRQEATPSPRIEIAFSAILTVIALVLCGYWMFR